MKTSFFIAVVLFAGCWNPTWTVKGSGIFVSAECVDMISRSDVEIVFDRFAANLPKYIDHKNVTTTKIYNLYPALYIEYVPSIWRINNKDGVEIKQRLLGWIQNSQIKIDCTRLECGGALEHELFHAIEAELMGNFFYSTDHSEPRWAKFKRYIEERECK